jgi:predicted RNase H-like nuclease (RuvC/YqgF family)
MRNERDDALLGVEKLEKTVAKLEETIQHLRGTIDAQLSIITNYKNNL